MNTAYLQPVLTFVLFLTDETREVLRSHSTCVLDTFLENVCVCDGICFLPNVKKTNKQKNLEPAFLAIQ